jgi:hypothetical protein
MVARFSGHYSRIAGTLFLKTAITTAEPQACGEHRMTLLLLRLISYACLDCTTNNPVALAR